MRGFLCHLTDFAARQWRQPDSGIWEGREGMRHSVSSKMLSWCALDSAIELADRLGPNAKPRRWARQARRLRRSIIRHGWSDAVGAYTGAYGSDHLDASNLLMAVYEFLPADDARMSATIDRIATDLGDDGLVSRWTGDDDQGWFVLSSCWLADCLARRGDVGAAHHVIERVLAHANDVGLLSEQIDRDSGDLLGNFPQAFCHAGVINAAASIDRAERRLRGVTTGNDER